AKAAGTDPMQSHRTRSIRTVRLRRGTADTTGVITALATTALDTTARGATPKNSTSIGVINAPPPMPVRPTTVPTQSAPIASVQSTGTPFGTSSPKSTGTTEMIGLAVLVNADVGHPPS